MSFAQAASATDAQDVAAIKTIVESVATLADQQNFDSLEKLYADEIAVDYTSLAGGDPQLKSPQGLMNEWAASLPGFDRTRHEISNVVVEVTGLKAVVDFLSALESKDMEKFADVWAEDAVQDMPFSPKGFPKRVPGKANLIAHYAGWPENAGEADFTSALVFYPMQDPQMVFAEFKERTQIIPTGRVYDQTYGGLFHVEDGKIKLFREFYNPAVFKSAFGLDEDRQFHKKQ